MARPRRRRRRARPARRLDGGAARALRRPHPGAARAAHPEPRVDRSCKRVVLSPADLERANVNLVARRPVRGRALARPELPLAAVPARSPGHATRDRRPVAHRREHASRPGPRRRLRHARRRSGCCGRGSWAMRCGSISQISTVPQPFDDDLDALSRCGRGRDRPLGDEVRRRTRSRASGRAVSRRRAASRRPVDPAAAADPGLADPPERVEAFCAFERLAPFEPACLALATGPGGRSRAVVDGFRTSRTRPRARGVRIALEPIQQDSAELLDDRLHARRGGRAARRGRPPGGRARRPTPRHLWNSPRHLTDAIERLPRPIVGVHLADWREPTRNTNDRVLPGDGAVDSTRSSTRCAGTASTTSRSSPTPSSRLAVAGRPARGRSPARSGGAIARVCVVGAGAHRQPPLACAPRARCRRRVRSAPRRRRRGRHRAKSSPGRRAARLRLRGRADDGRPLQASGAGPPSSRRDERSDLARRGSTVTWPRAPVMPVQNGLGAEEIVRRHGPGRPLRRHLHGSRARGTRTTRGRVRPRHRDLARPVRRHRRARRRDRRAARLFRR